MLTRPCTVPCTVLYRVLYCTVYCRYSEDVYRPQRSSYSGPAGSYGAGGPYQDQRGPYGGDHRGYQEYRSNQVLFKTNPLINLPNLP